MESSLAAPSTPAKAGKEALERSANGEYITQQEARRIVAQHRTLEPIDTPPLPAGKYRAIVVDPPWHLEKIPRDVRPNQDAMDYSVMSLEDIAALQIEELAAEGGCHIYLWTTHRFLPDALHMMKTWGFRYECVLTWIKKTSMTPFSWMYNSEMALFGRRGDLPLIQMGQKLSFEAPTTGHSRKPDIFYERVRNASCGPRLNLFAREKRDGFVAWGSEADFDGRQPRTQAGRKRRTLICS